MLQAGVGAPLLKLWVLAALDPAATAKGDLGEGDLGVSGIGRARARPIPETPKSPSPKSPFAVAAGSSAARTQSFSSGAPTPAWSTGDAS